MRVGIEARFLTHPQRGGFKSYTKTVVSALVEADSDNQYILYTDRISDLPSELPSNFSIRPVSACNAIVREQIVLPRAMEKDMVDVAHFPCNTSSIFCEVPLVVTTHDLIPLRKNSSRKNTLRQRLLRLYWKTLIPKSAHQARLIITSSEYVKRDVSSTLGTPLEKISVVPIAINSAFSNMTAGQKPSEQEIPKQYILAFAAADGRKNHTSVINAFLDISHEFPALSLVLICAHPDVQSQIESAVDAGVITLNSVSTEELIWLYKHATALVFPSLDEGFGLPPLEAMACGTAVVASDSGSLPEVLEDGAVYVDPFDQNDLAQKIKLVLTDDILRDTLISRGMKQVSNFTGEQMGRSLSSIYAEALSLGKNR